MSDIKEKKLDFQKLSRRKFIKSSFFIIASVGTTGGILYTFHNKITREKRAFSRGKVEIPEEIYFLPSKSGDIKGKIEAMFYKKLSDKRIQCLLCFRECKLKEGERGFCNNKINKEGAFYSLVYGRPSALQLDPVEKEPCFHLMPGTIMLSIGTAGCNNKCKFCHNWHLSQRAIDEIEYYELIPEDIINIALKYKCQGLSFTYNEPTTFYEYMYDIMKAGKKRALKVLFHTNGGMKEEPMKKLLELTDAVTVDLKAFTEKFYKEVSLSELKPVLNTLKVIKKKGVHLEIVNLVIPTLNDNMNDIKSMCLWIRDNLSDETPLHFTRFFPSYKLQKLPPTPVKTLEEARRIATEEAKLKYVYIGNVPGHKFNSTFCAKCGKEIIKRHHFEVKEMNVKDGKCSFCSNKIPGVFS